jgi:lysophospholipase L1-like esterase
MFRHWAVLLIAASLIAVGCKAASDTADNTGNDTSVPPAAVPGFPSSMVALGDSLTAAFGSCLAPTSCPRNSWSTGNGTQVNSHYKRILDSNPAIADHQVNLAVPGATVADLAGQAAQAAQGSAEYVTVLIGANDACRGEMTTPQTFRTQLASALTVIHNGLPNAHILMVGIPNVYRVWEIGHTNKLALGVWKSGVCPNLLANASSMADADVARRSAFRDRITAYNAEIGGACAAVPHCRFNEIASFAFELTMLSAIDFFHPNASGQTALAEVTYPDAFDW